MIRPKTKEEIKKLAFATVKGEVFTSEMLPKIECAAILKNIFMPLWVLNADQIADIRAYKPVMFYAYYAETLPHIVDGYPVFHSIRMLNADEFDQFYRWGVAYERALEAMHRVVNKMGVK